jgi:hypothetical protein
MRLGVTPARPEFDDMGKLLKSLGEGYKYHAFPLDDLGDPKKISDYTIIFLTCSGAAESWVKEKTTEHGPRPDTVKVTLNPDVMKKVAANLQEFVGNGGTLYASDLHYGLVAAAFPEVVDSGNIDKGRVQTVTAEVVDPGLREKIGPQISLKFDQPDWRPAAFSGEDVTTYLQGPYQTSSGEQKTTPLLVKFPYKKGTVIFTSFHNEKVAGKTELELLRYLVFAAITAKVDSEVTQTLAQGGFSAAKRSIFSASREQASITQTYRCTKAGELKFVLGFNSPATRLKLTVVSPEGQSFVEDGTSTLTVDVPHATIGDWKYTVTAVQLPSENFAYTVTVGQK